MKDKIKIHFSKVVCNSENHKFFNTNPMFRSVMHRFFYGVTDEQIIDITKTLCNEISKRDELLIKYIERFGTIK